MLLLNKYPAVRLLIQCRMGMMSGLLVSTRSMCKLGKALREPAHTVRVASQAGPQAGGHASVPLGGKRCRLPPRRCAARAHFSCCSHVSAERTLLVDLLAQHLVRASCCTYISTVLVAILITLSIGTPANGILRVLYD